MTMKFKIGDSVVTTSGKKFSGIVAGFHTVKRGKKTRDLAGHVLGDSSALDLDQIVVVSMDVDSWVRASAGQFKLLRKKRICADVAVSRLRDVKTAIKISKMNRRSAKYSAALDANGGAIYDCNIGDTIQIKFRDGGWVDAKFSGIVNGSGNVRFSVIGQNGRTRTTAPQFARVQQ